MHRTSQRGWRNTWTPKTAGRTHHIVSDVNEINMGWETEIFTFKIQLHVRMVFWLRRIL